MAEASRGRLIKNLSWSMALPPIRFVYAYLLAAILTRNLSIEQYGDWSLFVANIGLVITFSSLNLMYASSVRLTGKSFDEQREDIYRVGLFKFGMTLVVFVGFGCYLYSQGIFSLRIIGLMGIALVFRSLTDMTFGFLRALMRLRQQVIAFLIESVLILVFVAAGTVTFGGGLIGGMIGFVMAEFVTALVGYRLLRDCFGTTSWSWTTIREYLRIGVPLIPFIFSDTIVNALLPLLIKTQSGSEMVGLYSIAQKVALLSSVPNAIISNIYAQYLRRAFLDLGGAGVRRKLMQFMALYAAIIIPILAILYFFGDRLILLISTPDYLTTVDLVMLLAYVNVIIMMTALFTTIFAVYDRARSVGMLWIVVLILFLAIAWYAIPAYGLMGTAYSLIISFGLGLLVVAARGLRLTYSSPASQN